MSILVGTCYAVRRLHDMHGIMEHAESAERVRRHQSTTLRTSSSYLVVVADSSGTLNPSDSSPVLIPYAQL